jgi:hypothetical protein
LLRVVQSFVIFVLSPRSSLFALSLSLLSYKQELFSRRANAKKTTESQKKKKKKFSLSLFSRKTELFSRRANAKKNRITKEEKEKEEKKRHRDRTIQTGSSTKRRVKKKTKAPK